MGIPPVSDGRVSRSVCQPAIASDRLRHVINQLAARLPQSERNSGAVRELTSYGCPTRTHVVRLLAPRLSHEDHTKDIDFSPSGIMQRWDAGYRHTKSVLEKSLGRRIRSAHGCSVA